MKRQHSSTSSDPSGSTLHINPMRSRTPRAFSLTTPTPSLQYNEMETSNLSPESDISSIDIPVVDEKTPLVGTLKTMHEEEGFLEISPRKLLADFFAGFRWAPRDSKWRRQVFKSVKIVAIFTITVVCCGELMSSKEEKQHFRTAVVPRNSTHALAESLCEDPSSYLRVQIYGPFYQPSHKNDSAPPLTVNLGSDAIFHLKVNASAKHYDENFKVTTTVRCCRDGNCSLTVSSPVQMPVTWYTRELTWHVENEVVYAFLVLAFVYILIIFELVHRTLAALLGALVALAVLSALNERPTMATILTWIDTETLCLLLGMMLIVGVFSETGFFDYSALVAYRLAKGKIWRLITLLCVFSGVISAFLDNVTTMLLVAPVTIRLCEVLNLEPQRILIAEVLFSNIGGTATAIGDPPNVIIVGALSSRGITFTEFTVHAFPGILFVGCAGYAMLRLYYRNMEQLKNKDPPQIAEMKHEVTMWRRAAGRLQVVTREETLMRALFLQKAVEIEHVLYKTLHRRRREESQDLKDTIRKLESQYRIKDFGLLIKSGLVVLVVISMLFMYSFVSSIHLDIGWIAVLGAMWLLVVADVEDFDGVLHKVEWSTLLFFAALFILMEALAELGLIKTIGNGIADIIVSVDESHRLLLAVILILWVSAISSSFIDNIPYTTAMVPVLVQLADDPAVNLPLVPLVVALAFGACLGGNGTLIGASCNVVCAGIAEQHGYGFTFWDFFKIGFPMMLVSTVASTGYVLLCHVALEWNYV